MIITPKPNVARVLVCGSRTFDDYPLMCRKLHLYTAALDEFCIVTGAQKSKRWENGKWVYYGADYLAEEWGHREIGVGFNLYRFHADWETHGKAAGPIRNNEMIEFIKPDGYCIAFWDGESHGTEDMIAKCRRNLPADHIRVVMYKEEQRA